MLINWSIAKHNFMQNWQLKPSASEGYGTAEVTLGGVDTCIGLMSHPELYLNVHFRARLTLCSWPPLWSQFNLILWWLRSRALKDTGRNSKVLHGITWRWIPSCTYLRQPPRPQGRSFLKFITSFSSPSSESQVTWTVTWLFLFFASM